YESDFADSSKPIVINITLHLDDIEVGYFDELFEPENEKEIEIIAKQEKTNGRLEFIHNCTDTIIPYSKIKNLPFVYYNSVQSPEELNFSKTKTTGKFFNNLIQKYIDNNQIKTNDIIVEDKINNIIASINSLINKIDLIKETGVSAKIENDATLLIPKLIGLSDENKISINNMGSGVRYISYIFFEILNTIMKYCEHSNDILFKDTNGCTYLPIIITLDEPEIHLHPYMQRNLIKSLRKIIENNDSNFLNLIKECFGIDKLLGQLIVSTHSPNILSNDYKEFIRMYKKNNNIYSKSGDQIILDTDNEKHLLMHLPEIKESFFASVAMHFEGISEVGTIPIFAEKLAVDIDFLRISIISADGKENVLPLKCLLNDFDIDVVSVVDRDDDTELNSDYMYTNSRDLECDIVDKCLENDSIDELIKTVKQYKINEMDKKIQKTKINKNADKLNINFTTSQDYSLNEAIAEKDDNLIKILFVSWLWKNKDMVRGRLIGEFVSKNNIPDVYIKAINKAGKIAEKIMNDDLKNG
ncbi:MAG: AAA family ATPase, partial [Clostridia bacterium]